MKRPPLYWSAHREDAAAASGARFRLKVWGWSDVSAEDAAAVAAERARRLMARGGPGSAPADWYYPASPLREQLLDTLAGESEPLAIVTRNRYGASVLNTDAVVIADVDLPEEPRPRGGLIARLLGRGGGAADPADGVRERVVAFSEAHPELGVHSYRTRAGFRIILTGTGCAPGDDRSTALLEELGSDPLYVTLCRAQSSFRARLTPKPWRVGLRAMAVRWPAADERTDRWLADYEERCVGRAVCAREAAFGPGPSADEQRVIDLHDRATAAASGLPLA